MTRLQPTNIRFLVVSSTALMSILLYLDRFCISFAEVFIKEDLGLTDVQVGWMLSAFFWTYALGQVPSGWLTDRFGSRIMLTAYILSWSLFTGLTGAATAFAVLLILRFGFGFAQAGAYPTGASIISKWVPFPSRGLASSVVAMGGRVGGWLALYATGFVIVWLTPLSTPTDLQVADVLAPARLCYELSTNAQFQTADQAAGRRIAASLSTAQRSLVDRHAARYAAALEAERNRLQAAGREVDDKQLALQLTPPSAADMGKIVTALNRVIGQRGIFVAEQLKDWPLEKEAVRLLALPADELADAQATRLNRLVLEAIHRQSLRKLYGAGWRPMMYLYGALGLVVAALVWLNCRNQPADHPTCNSAEIELIESDSRMVSAGKVRGVPLRPLLLSVSMWFCCLSQWATNVGWVFVMTWAPRYFQNVHQVSLEERALMVSIPPMVGWGGMILGGLITDRLVDKIGLRWGRALPMALSRFLAMGAYLACLFQPSPWLAVAMFSIVTFSTDLGTASVWAFNQDVGGRYVGSVLGWGNMWGNLGAAMTPPLLIWIVGESQNWELAFITCAAAFLISGVAALGVNATIPIAPLDKDD